MERVCTLGYVISHISSCIHNGSSCKNFAIHYMSIPLTHSHFMASGVSSQSCHEDAIMNESEVDLREHSRKQLHVEPNGSPVSGHAPSSSKSKENEVSKQVSQHRLSQAVPKPNESYAFLNEDQPWDTKNILSFGELILPLRNLDNSLLR